MGHPSLDRGRRREAARHEGGESESAARHGTLLRWEGKEIEAYLYAPFSKMPLLLSF